LLSQSWRMAAWSIPTASALPPRNRLATRPASTDGRSPPLADTPI